MKNKIINSIVLSFIILLFTNTTGFAIDKNTQDVVSYLNSKKDTSIDLDGNGTWCVDLIVDYMDFLQVPRVWGNAYEYKWKIPADFERLSNWNAVKTGDILVTKGINSFMHVNIVISNNNGIIKTVDQNVDGKRYVVERVTSKSEIVSILRPNLKNLEKGKWIKDNIGWWYKYSEGWYPYSKWEKISNKWYYFDENGYMKTDWIKLSDKWYYLKENGDMARNEILEIDENIYKFNDNGELENI